MYHSVVLIRAGFAVGAIDTLDLETGVKRHWPGGHEQLAGFVNISQRTLARHLAAEDTRFRDISLQVRTERARQMLAEGDLSVTQIAYRLGYTDVASFVRSFRAQTGRTPGSLRA